MRVAAPTCPFTEAVESGLAATLAAPPDLDPGHRSVLLDAVRHLALAPGAKRVRPRLVAMFGELAGAAPADLVDVAVAGELIHSGSLLHDDVVDGGTQRRGRPSANAAWGNLVAVLGGDLCLTLAFVRLATHPRRITDEAVATIAEMTRGTMAEAELRGRIDADPESAVAVARGKTGSLFAWCARSTARLAGDDLLAERFGQAGLRLGLAFQLADDLLDLVGGSGKDRFADLRNQEPTWPLLRAAALDPALAREIERAWRTGPPAPERVAELGAAVLAGPAVAECAARIAEEARLAVAALGRDAERPGGREIAAWAAALSLGVSGAAVA